MAPEFNRNNLSTEDKTKILSEINQIHNQRFQLTISAITVFGVFIAWIIPKNDSTKQASEFLFIAPILLLIFLFLLFLYAHTLNQTLITLATYLTVTEQSKWEKDSKTYRGIKGVGFAYIQDVIFILLGLVTFSFPFLLCHLNNSQFPTFEKAEYTLTSSGIIYIIVILGLSYFNRVFYEKIATRKWEDLKKEGKI